MGKHFLIFASIVFAAAAHAGDKAGPLFNEAGYAQTFSSTGTVDPANPFFVPQGSNGRSCATCHAPEAGWSIRPNDVEKMFADTGGLHPIFNLLDADNPRADVSTAEARRAAYSMLLKSLFRRGGAVPANAEFEIVAFDDPLGAGGSLARFEFFRRSMATANFHIAKNVGWHDQNTNGSGNVHAGLVSQAAGNVTGGQQGPPASAATIDAIVALEESLRFAQQFAYGAGPLDICGARGGAAHLSAQAPVAGRFDLFDAWLEPRAGGCAKNTNAEGRLQVAHGQQLFNSTNANGRSCAGCHNAANNGSNIEGRLFDIGASRAEFREPGMPLYTLRNKATLEERRTTDPGRALRSGRWADLDRFKVPSLRGLASRPPYFHNGIAPTLRDVVVHYERAMGFSYTDEERDALVTFLEAL